jgi:hypothetical protein
MKRMICRRGGASGGEEHLREKKHLFRWGAEEMPGFRP